MTSTSSYPTDVRTRQVQPIHFWQHGRAVASTLAAYPHGTDAFVDEIRSAPLLRRVAFQYLLAPLHFAAEEGWTIRDERGEMAAIMYLSRGSRQGIRVMHIDDVSVGQHYRRLGLAQRLMTLAEELAIREKRAFLKLAVTVSNTPACTLYRRLGYEDQHHRYFTWSPSSNTLHPATSPASRLMLCPLGKSQAERVFQQLYRMELKASVPALADMLAAYYGGGMGLTGVPRSGTRYFAVLQDDKQIGYGDQSRKGATWNLRLSLHPDWWGTETERYVISQLAGTIPADQHGAEIALYVPSAAHFEAIRANPYLVDEEPCLVEHTFDRMIMAKSLS
jgi:ribosomal protein S18 acetylase RimI-like enzyme